MGFGESVLNQFVFKLIIVQIIDICLLDLLQLLLRARQILPRDPLGPPELLVTRPREPVDVFEDEDLLVVGSILQIYPHLGLRPHLRHGLKKRLDEHRLHDISDRVARRARRRLRGLRLQYQHLEPLAQEGDEAEEADCFLYHPNPLDVLIECLPQKMRLNLVVPGHVLR